MDQQQDLISSIDNRPEREKIINNEDLLNLKIALETAKSLKEFLDLI